MQSFTEDSRMTWGLFDADMLLHKTVASCEREIEWMPNVITTHILVSEAQQMFRELVVKLQRQAKASRITLCWTAESNFRLKVDSTYKGNRRGTLHRRKPVGYKAMRQWAEQEFPSECWYDLEGDDVLGILATRHPDEAVIWSGDKDLMQIPGAHLNDAGEIETVSQLQADAFFYRQILTGDTTDGYPGCPGCGKVSAAKLVPEEGFTEATAWRAVVKQFEKKHLGADYALRQARLARILRDSEYQLDELQLWTPPTIQYDQATTGAVKM